MTVVIQCAATKRSNAGHFITELGQSVDFVARPAEAPKHPGHTYARPDDPAENGVSWRQTLLNYNAKRGNNPLGLLPAFELYQNEMYRRLVDRFGATDVYILSAGWGLIRADFLTPYYDITFSSSAEHYRRPTLIEVGTCSAIFLVMVVTIQLSVGATGQNLELAILTLHKVCEY